MIDAYDLQARHAPAVVAILPAVLVALALVPGLGTAKLAAGSIAFILVVALEIVAMRIVRSIGQSKQAALYARWGGMPTTAMLRHRDTRLNSQTKQIYHNRLRRLGPDFPIPDVDEEQRDPQRADVKFGAAMDEVRRRAKAIEVRSVHRENINYGTARNVYGLKSFGLAVCGLSEAGLAAIIVLRGGFRPMPLELAVGFAIFILAGAWIFACKADMVRHHAEAYALALFEAIDTVVPAKTG